MVLCSFSMWPCSFQLHILCVYPLHWCWAIWLALANEMLANVSWAKAWNMLVRFSLPSWVSCHSWDIDISQGAIWCKPRSNLQLADKSNRTYPRSARTQPTLKTYEHDNKYSLWNDTELWGHLLHTIIVGRAGWVIHLLFLILPSCCCEYAL